MFLGRDLYREPRVLSEQVALKIAAMLKVPSDREPLFCDCICGAVQEVWEWDRRAVSSAPRDGLLAAANAARSLEAALQSLNPADRAWLGRVSAQHVYPASKPEFRLDDLDWTVSTVACLLGAAAGRSRPDSSDDVRPRNRGRRPGDVSDKAFHDFVWNLFHSASAAGVAFTLDKNFKTGTLIDALDVLRPHMPRRFIPPVLPLGTLQKIQAKFNSRHANIRGASTVAIIAGTSSSTRRRASSRVIVEQAG